VLVITRREGQRLQIGPGITITVVRVDPKSVRIGIDAPQDAIVMRTELLQRSDGDGQIPQDSEDETTSRA